MANPTPPPGYEIVPGAVPSFRTSPPPPPPGYELQQPPGAIASAADGVGQGLTFGFSDELEGAGRAALSKINDPEKPWGQAWSEGVAVPRARQAAEAEAHPVAYYGGQIAGGIAVPAGLAGLGVRGAAVAGGVARAGLGTRSAAAAGEGALYGAGYGAGTAEGGLQDRAIGAATGAAAGAVGGALMPGAVDLVAGGARAVTAPLRGVLQPTRFGQEKVAEAMLRDKNPGQTVNRSVEGVTDQLRTLRDETGKDLRLADLGGENTRNQLRAAANQSSTGAQKLNRTLDGPTRQGSQWRRIERDMSRGLGSPDDYAASIDQIVAERDALSKPLFDKAMAADVKPTDDLVNVLQRPGMQEILKRTAAKMENEGADVSGSPPMVLLHRSKMEIDKAINDIKAGQSNTANWDIRTLTKMKHDLLDAIDSPDYREALRVSAGENALKGAAQDGLDEALTIPTEDLTRKMRSFKNESERDMYRLGASRALAGKIRRGNITSDRTENVFSSPDIQMRMRAVFPNAKAMREFQRDLVLEARMADTRKAVQGNSSTAKQLAQGREAGQPVAAVGAAANAMMGRLEPLMNVLGRSYNSFTGLTPRTANAMIDASMSRGGDDAVSGAMQNAMAAAEHAPIRRANQVRSLNAGANAGMQAGLGQDPPGLRGGIGPRYDEYARRRPGQ